MLLFKALGTDCYLVEDLIARRFDRLGKFIGIDNNLSTGDLAKGVRVNAVSIVQYNGNEVILAVHNNNILREYKVAQGYIDICMLLTRERNALKILNTKGVHEGVNYVQTILVYSYNINIDRALEKIGILLGEEVI